MPYEDLNDEQKQQIKDFKEFNEKVRAEKPKGGKRPKEFSNLLKMAAMVMRDAGFSINAISQELKVHPATAAKILRDKSVKVETKDLDKVREQFSTHIAEIILKMLSTANSSEYIYNLSRSKNPGLIQALSALIEKLQLLQGKPSGIMEVRDVAKSANEKLKELEDLEQTLQQALQNKDPKAN